MLSLQTNVTSLVAQQNLNVNNDFQAQTITRLTSGYRINSSGDDAAGLVVANEYRSSVAELNQGVRNANDGLSQLQIMDGGLNNISQILDRMKTLATESSSTTFTGDRTTLNNEFTSLIGEITRQASDIGLASGGQYNTKMNIYIGGGNIQSNGEVALDLSGSANQVDAAGLGLSNATLLGGGVTMGSVNLNAGALNGMVLSGVASGASQVFTLNTSSGSKSITISSTTSAGISVDTAVSQLNAQLSAYGITASVNSTTGFLQLSGGSTAFSIKAAAATVGANSGLVAASDVTDNTAMYRVDNASSSAPTSTFTGIGAAQTENLSFTVGSTTVGVSLTNANSGTMTAALSTLNTALNGVGITAVQDAKTGGIAFESNSAFTVVKGTGAGQVAGVFADATGGAITDTASNPVAGTDQTSNSLSAITSIDNAIKALGLVQGHVGAGENTLNYAISLAQSQISNFSAAESRIRDADVAAEAANLTKAQVLQQASMAALAQANAAPQAVLALLKG